MTNKRFLISLLISLFINICLINIFSQIFAINDFPEKKEMPMYIINIEFINPDDIQLPVEDIKNQPDFPEKENLKILNRENGNKEDNSAEKPVPQQAMVDMEEGKSVEHEAKAIAVKESEVQLIGETKEEQEQYLENVAEEETVDQEENDSFIERKSKPNFIQIEMPDLLQFASSQEEYVNEKDETNGKVTPLDFTISSEMDNRIVPPKIISFLQPEYPENLRKREIEGNVQLKVLIDSRGKVSI